MSPIINALLGGNPETGDRIEARPLKFSGVAGITSAMVAIAGAIPAVLQALDELNLSDTQFLGVVGLIAAGVLGFAIASAGDALARAYSAAWVVPKSDERDAHPALMDVAVALGRTAATAPGEPLPEHKKGIPVVVTQRREPGDSEDRQVVILGVENGEITLGVGR